MTKHEVKTEEEDVEEKSARRANSMDVHVGSRVRLRRMLLGMSQEKLGEKLGLTFQQVQKYEKGINRVGAGRLHELGRVLGVPVSFFFEDAPGVGGAEAMPGFAETTNESYVNDFLGNRDGLELNKAFVRITDAKVRRAIVEMVRALADDAERQ